MDFGNRRFTARIANTGEIIHTMDEFLFLLRDQGSYSSAPTAYEIYGLRNTRGPRPVSCYNRVILRFALGSCCGGRPEVVIVEDSNSGYEFYRALCEKSGIRCVSAEG